jgi:hypothetical protein
MGIILNLFGALVVAIILWILCAFSGRIINSNYRMPKLLHLLCFAVFIPTVIFLFAVFTCGNLIRAVERAETGIVKFLMADGKFVEQVNRLINQTMTTNNVDELTDYLGKNIIIKFSELPIVGRYVDVNKLMKGIAEKISNLLQSRAETGAAKVQQLVQSVVGWLTEDIKAKIRAWRLNALVVVIVFQTIAFGVVMCRAGKFHRLQRARTRK